MHVDPTAALIFTCELQTNTEWRILFLRINRCSFPQPSIIAMADFGILIKQRTFGQTARRDIWWLQPVLVFAGLSTFVVYATWAALQGGHYFWGPYISPFYSPLLFGDSQHSLFGPKPSWLPDWGSPALLILWIPGGFRLTCYYYRGAYYKAFWADPPSCSVGEPRASYRGENAAPLIAHNLHRYFLYIALPFLLFLVQDVWEALWFTNPGTGQASLGMGVGTIVLAANVIFLSGYALGCHSLRHLIGGGTDEMSKVPMCLKGYNCVSLLNLHHMRWAWLSLFWVMFSDLYVRLCSMGVWTDWRIL